MNIQTKKVIDVNDWDDLVSETYGRPYSFQQQDDCKPRGTETITASKGDIEDYYTNDTVKEVVNGPEMGVSFKAWLARDPKQPLSSGRADDFGLDLWWDRNFYPHVDMVANDLCKKGLLEEGEYLIDIDW